MVSINTRAAWRPVLRPIGKLLVAAQLALVLQPLSVLAQDEDQGRTSYKPQVQAQAAKAARSPAAVRSRIG